MGSLHLGSRGVCVLKLLEVLLKFNNLYRNLKMIDKLIIFLFLSQYAIASEESTNRRKPKLFFVSTSSTTSTISTRTLCYTTNAALGTCGRKKRAIVDIKELEGDIAPAPIQKVDVEEDNMEIEDDLVTGGINEDSDRNGKFLLYWMTTTLTSTTPSFTVTQTLSVLDCTPAAVFSLNACGK